MSATRVGADFNLYRDVEKPKNNGAKCACLIGALLILAMGTYCTVAVIIKKTATPMDHQAQIAEKLTVTSPSQFGNIQKLLPQPFGVKVLGPAPQEFTPTTSTLTPTTVKMPKVLFPQLSNYQSHQPKNIQEILKYINKQRSYDMENQKDKEKQATNQEGFKHALDSSGFNTDPFHPYKPSDPSEINLLATASFRFAPPIWKNFRKLHQQPEQPSKRDSIPNLQQVDTSNIQETIRNFARPFIVTLNILPMDDQYPYPVLSRYGQRTFSQRIQGTAPYQFQGDPRARFFGDRNKITVKLNVFPETLFSLLGQEEKASESNVNKIKFV